MKFRWLQIRWKEPLGRPECPYMYRWVFNFGLFSIRVHHWLRSDDKRFFHDHPWSFISIVLKGGYTDVSEEQVISRRFKYEESARTYAKIIGEQFRPVVELESHQPFMSCPYFPTRYKVTWSRTQRDELKFGSIRFRKAEHRHYVDVPKGGCWSLLFCGPPTKSWGFWVKYRYFRPLRFFSRHGHPPCSEQ